MTLDLFNDLTHSDEIVSYIDIDLPKTGITKNQLLMIDILANNDWN